MRIKLSLELSRPGGADPCDLPACTSGLSLDLPVGYDEFEAAFIELADRALPELVHRLCGEMKAAQPAIPPAGPSIGQ